MTEVREIIRVQLLADLRVQPVSDGALAFVVGKMAVGDGLGGFYRWDPVSVVAEDSAFLNTIQSTVATTGRWIRIFQRARNLPHGVLVMNGGVKTFYASGVTDSNGEITLNLTENNTATGTAIFTEIWFNDSKSTVVATSPSNAVTSYVKSLAANLKTTTHGFFKANALTITLGLVYGPFAAVGANIPVQFRIEGV